MAKDKDVNDKTQEDPDAAKKEFDAAYQDLLGGADNVVNLEDHNPDLKIMNELNRNHIFIEDLGGKPAVTLMLYSEVTGKKELNFIHIESFKQIYMNRTIALGNRPVPIGQYWLQDSRRTTVKAITFDPSQTKQIIEIDGESYLNLWNGLGVAPIKGCWKKTRRHIWKILCNSDPVKFKYVLQWLAFAVQRPETRAEVALVFKGEQGGGKSFLFVQFKKIFGTHGMVVSDPNRLVGKFNSHFRSLCFLFCDEAYFPGDKEVEGVMKSRITEEYIDTEAKGRDPITLKNRLHIAMCTNKDLVIPASKDVRRFFIEAINNMYAKGRAPDRIRKQYFDPLFREMENGGREAMLYDLQKINIKNWHPRDNVPDTQELRTQKELNLNSLENAVKQMIEEGLLPGEFKREEYHVPSDSVISYLEKLEPHCVKFSSVKKAKIIKELGAVKSRIGGSGRVKWIFPELKDMRKKWDEAYGDVAWDEQEKWTVIKTDY